MKKMLIIGIAGGSGSGKSTAAELIADEFGEEVTLLRHDDYYKTKLSTKKRTRKEQSRITTVRMRSIRSLCQSI